MDIPWVEKYRPLHFENIILNQENKTLIENMIEGENMYNMILYGPPGTGKTTTIMNIIKKYNEKMDYKSNVIHLNASDERGVETIRTNIFNFVNSKSMFKDTKKFIILDEVDYMTKNAQFALQYILKDFKNTHFCLICNYISKIIPQIRYKLMVIKFNNLDPRGIHNFLTMICEKEDIKINKDKLETIRNHYNTDIRSMINYIQTNHINFIFDKKAFLKLLNQLNRQSINKKNIEKLIKKYKISNGEFILLFFKYFIYENKFDIKKINLFQTIIHNNMGDVYLLDSFIEIFN